MLVQIARLVALRKVSPVRGRVTPVRPVAIGCCLRRLISKQSRAKHLKAVKKYCCPIQVAVGVSGAMPILAFGGRMLLDTGELACGKADVMNAFQEWDRGVLVKLLAEPEAEEDGLLPLLPVVHKMYTAAVPLSSAGKCLGEFTFDNPRDGRPGQVGIDSQQGGQQGDPQTGDVFCVLMQPAFKQLQDELQARPGAVAGTCVRGGMDDTYIFCRPEDMAWAYGRLERSCWQLGD